MEDDEEKNKNQQNHEQGNITRKFTDHISGQDDIANLGVPCDPLLEVRQQCNDSVTVHPFVAFVQMVLQEPLVLSCIEQSLGIPMVIPLIFHNITYLLLVYDGAILEVQVLVLKSVMSIGCK